MLISKIQNTYNKQNRLPDNKKVSGFAFLGNNLKENEISFLKEKAKKYPHDIDYKKKLLINAGKNPDEYYRLYAIVGPQELLEIMKKNSNNPDFFSAGEMDSNIKNGTMGANTHLHTLSSDGFLSAEEFLEKSSAHADFIAQSDLQNQRVRKFLTGVSDHDTAESANDLINLVYENPIKYKNLGVVLGVEHTTFDKFAPDVFSSPTSAHILAYGIDPNEKTYAAFLQTYKNTKSEVLKKMIDDSNRIYQKSFRTGKKIFSVQEAENFYNPLKKNIMGTFNYARTYIKTKLVLEEVVVKNKKFLQIFDSKGIKPDADFLTQGLRDYFYKVDKTNKARAPEKTISLYLAEILQVEPSDVEKILNSTQKSEGYLRFVKTFETDVEKFNAGNYNGFKYVPDAADVYQAFKNQPETIIGVAHPLELTEKISGLALQKKYLVSFYEKFKKKCKEKALFTEVYYQSYGENVKQVQDNTEIKKLVDSLSKKLDLFKFGGSDTHRKNLFKRYFK